jgi:HEAT repeat protein
VPRIDEIPWHTLHHAYGTCDEFPQVVRRLASGDPKDRSRARNWLEELLFHQGTHYPANEFAVPFLIEAASTPALPERTRFFEFLSRFLLNRKPPLSPGQRDKFNRKLQKQLQYGFGDGAEHWRDYRRRSLAAAWGCRDLLVGMLRNDPDIAGRCWAAYALADLAKTGRRDGGGWTEEKPTRWYTPAAAAEILALLRGCASTDPSVPVRVSSAFGIGFLRDEPGAREALEELFSQGDEAVRVAAAAARHVVETSVPPEVTACVVDGIVKNRLPGQQSGYVAVYDPDHPLAAAYANLGLPLVEADAGTTHHPPGKPFAFVPFPRLPAWLNASLDERVPLAVLVRRSLRDATARERTRAVRFLGAVKLPQPEIGRMLKRLMKHSDPVVRMGAGVALRRRERKAPVGPIVEVFREPLQSPDAALRRMAVEGLGSMWTPGSGGPIPAALPWIAAAAEHETDRGVQKLICKLFERAAIEDESTSEAYQQAQRVASRWLGDHEIRRDALAALGDMHGRAVPEGAVDLLLAMLNSDDPGRQHVPGRLARVPSGRILPAFLEALSRETDPDVRRAIGWGLQKLPHPVKVVDAMLRAVREGKLAVDGPVGQPLVLIARELPTELLLEVASVVLGALRSPRTTATDREQLAEAAGWLTVEPEQVADALMQMALADPDARVRAGAANALACSKVPVEVLLPRAIQVAERGDDAALDGLLKLLDHGNTPEMPGLARSLLPSLDHPSYWRRQKTVSALARMAADDTEVERAVLRKLDDEHATVRYEATKYGFKRLPNEEIVPPLLKALRERTPSIYAWWSLRGFGWRGGAKARASTAVLLPIAEHLIGSETGLFLTDICDWLKEQGPAAAAISPYLVKLLDDPSPKSRFAKIEALLALDPSQSAAALQALDPMLTHELDAVRVHAAKMRDKICSEM